MERPNNQTWFIYAMISTLFYFSEQFKIDDWLTKMMFDEFNIPKCYIFLYAMYKLCFRSFHKLCSIKNPKKRCIPY